MPEPNANDPLPTTDYRPDALTPGPDGTADHAADSPPADGGTVSFVPAEAAERASPSAWVPGYEIDSVLGRGGMGVVYKARHTALKRTVALKMVLAGGHAGPRERARFRIEAEAVARLQHPNIVQIHEVGEAGGHPYCALEFVEGGTLARKIDGKPLPAREAARLVEALARAMHLAHSRNIVHRDLKPANILLAADGTPKITDFGLARQLDGDSGETQAGVVIGTPTYMAPEQAAGRAHEAGPAADLYALGAILYACLVGRPPFKGPSMAETLELVRTQEPAPPSRRQPGVPPDLDTICLKCLRKEPEQRYASAAELADELGRYQRGEPIRARPLGAVERAAKWARRNPAAAALVAAIPLLLLGVTAVSWWVAERERQTSAELSNSNHEKDEALKAVRVGVARLALDHGLMLCDQGDVSRGLGALTRALKAAVEADDADLESAVRLNLAAWARLAWHLRAVLPGPSGTHVGAAALNAPGTVLAVALANGTTQLWDATEGNEGRVQHTLPHDGRVVDLHFSADGRRLLTRTERTVSLWDVATGKPVFPPLRHEFKVWAAALDPAGKFVLTGEGETGKAQRNGAARLWDAETGRQFVQLLAKQDPVTAVAFRPDGLRAVTAGSNGKMQVWQIPSGQADGGMIDLKEWVTTARFSPDGTRVLAGTYFGRVHVRDAATGRPAFKPLVHDGPVEEMVFGPDRTTLAVRTGLGPVKANVRLWDAATGGRLTPPLAHPGHVRCCAFHPDGQTLLTAGNGGAARFWDTARGVAAGPPLYHHGDDVRAAAFSRDGRTLMTLDGHVRLWQAPRGLRRGAPLPHPGGAYAVTFSRDGKLALTGGQDGTARLWHAATAAPATKPLRHGGTIMAAAFSPDGKLALTGGGPRSDTDGDSKVRFWDTGTGQLRAVLVGHQAAIQAAAFSPDGATVLTGSSDGTARLWDVATGLPLGDPLTHGGEVGAVAFSPDGRLVLTGSSDRTARLWRVATRRPLGDPLPHTHAVETVAFAPDGRRAYTGSRLGKTIRSWDAATGLVRAGLSGHQGGVYALALDPNGRLVLSGSADRTARFWDAATGEPVGPPLQHLDTVRDVAFGPDGRTALTGSFDTTARRWHAPTGIPVGPPLTHRGKVRAVALSPDGKTAVTASWDGKAALWEAPPALPGAPAQLARWAQVITGLELDEGAAVRPLDGAAWQERRRRLGTLPGPGVE